MLLVVRLGFQDAKQVLCRGQRLRLAAGKVIRYQAIENESVEVDVLAAVRRLAGVANLGEVPAMPAIAHPAFEELKAGLRGGQCRLLLDAFACQRAEKPELPALHRQE